LYAAGVTLGAARLSSGSAHRSATGPRISGRSCRGYRAAQERGRRPRVYMPVELSRGERAAVYAALVPGFRADRKRYSTAYRGGDSPDALAIDLDRGWFDHALGDKGGDCVKFVMHARDCDFQ